MNRLMVRLVPLPISRDGELMCLKTGRVCLQIMLLFVIPNIGLHMRGPNCVYVQSRIVLTT